MRTGLHKFSKRLAVLIAVWVALPCVLTVPAMATQPTEAPVMLALSWNEKTDIAGWWMSEKLDGVRGYWTGSEMISRSGRTFDVPQWFTENFPPTALDGELWLGRGKFSELAGIVQRKNSEDGWKKVRYLIFDAPRAPGGFEKRLDFARRWFQKHGSPYTSGAGTANLSE